MSPASEDEQIAYDLKRTVAAMLRDGIPPPSDRRGDLGPLWHPGGLCGRGSGRGPGLKILLSANGYLEGGCYCHVIARVLSGEGLCIAAIM